MSESETVSVWGWRGETAGMSQRIKRAFETGERTDIQFEVGSQFGKEELFKAHKFALSISSDVFDTMFYGNIPEVEKTIKLPDIPPEAFRIMLKYLYTDVVEDLTLDSALSTLYCAQKYGIPLLVEICAEYAIKNVGKSTCLSVLEIAVSLDVEKVMKKCLDVVDTHCSEVLISAEFLRMKHETLQLILKRDTLRINEVEVYKAAERWASHACRPECLKPTGANNRRMLGEALFLVRFPLMDGGQIADGPVTTQLLLEEEAFKIYQFKHAAKKPDIRFSSVPRRPPNITFCGHQWKVLVNSSAGSVTDGMADNVFLDELGHLHLRLSRRKGVWTGSKIYSVDALGFGLYEFRIRARLDRLDPNVTFCMGNRSGNAGNRLGMDIRFAKWGDKSERQACYEAFGENSGAAPAVGRSSDHGFDFSQKDKCTTHVYTWKSTGMVFSSQYGHQDNSPGGIHFANEFESWIEGCTDVIPQKALPVAIFLHNYLGKPPSDGKEVEIVVESFRFLPVE